MLWECGSYRINMLFHSGEYILLTDRDSKNIFFIETNVNVFNDRMQYFY